MIASNPIASTARNQMSSRSFGALMDIAPSATIETVKFAHRAARCGSTRLNTINEMNTVRETPDARRIPSSTFIDMNSSIAPGRANSWMSRNNMLKSTNVHNDDSTALRSALMRALIVCSTTLDPSREVFTP